MAQYETATDAPVPELARSPHMSRKLDIARGHNFRQPNAILGAIKLISRATHRLCLNGEDDGVTVALSHPNGINFFSG